MNIASSAPSSGGRLSRPVSIQLMTQMTKKVCEEWMRTAIDWEVDGEEENRRYENLVQGEEREGREEMRGDERR